MPQSEFWPFVRSEVPVEGGNDGEASMLQKQLGDMEGEVKEIQMELEAIKRDRLDLLTRNHPVHEHSVLVENRIMDSGPPNGAEKVSHEDKFSKFPEITRLREELIKAKNVADEERFQKHKFETKLKDLEHKLNNICCKGNVNVLKDARKKSDDEVTSMKTQLRDLKEEMEDVKITLKEKNEQLQEYRVKYLQAQQQVEELKRQLDVIDFENKQVSDQIQIEIQRMKMQFQEKLQELAPLPDLLKGAQIQLQEAKQLQKLAEDSSSQLSNELHRVKEKLVTVVNSLNQEKAEKAKLSEEVKQSQADLIAKQKDIDELNQNVEEYKCSVMRLEEKLVQQELRLKEKSSECSQLLKDLDEMREENNRSLTRSKERSDSMRRYLQTQLTELERQLIQSRAQYRACQKERDEIRQRMQIQLNNLQENFELVEIRLRTLQNQVSSLKNSYSMVLADDDDGSDMNKIITA